MVAAIKWTQAKAADLGIDTTRVSLGTQSAGSIVTCPVPFELVILEAFRHMSDLLCLLCLRR